MLCALAVTDAQWGLIATTTLAISTVVVQTVAAARERHFRRAAELADRDYTDWSQRRVEREQVYADLLIFVLERVDTVKTFTLPSDLAGYRSVDDVTLRSRVGTLASDEVRAFVHTFREQLGAVETLSKEQRDGPADGAAWQNFCTRRDQLESAATTLELQVAHELNDPKSIRTR